MPSVSELPNFISHIRHPRRSNSISIGPQSAADAYEELAFRQKRRRESLSSGTSTTTGLDRNSNRINEAPSFFGVKKSESSPANGQQTDSLLPTPPSSSSNLSSSLKAPVAQTPLTPINSAQDIPGLVRTPSQDRRQNEKEEREIFSKLPRPRVRYDVEVVTKLIVYSGMIVTFSLVFTIKEGDTNE